MSVYNIVRKHQVLETNLKFEEINFYRVFSYNDTFIVISVRTSMFSFRETYFQLVGLFDWGYARTQFLLSVSRNQYGFTLARYRNEKYATDPALFKSKIKLSKFMLILHQLKGLCVWMGACVCVDGWVNFTKCDKFIFLTLCTTISPYLVAQCRFDKAS